MTQAKPLTDEEVMAWAVSIDSLSAYGEWGMNWYEVLKRFHCLLLTIAERDREIGKLRQELLYWQTKPR